MPASNAPAPGPPALRHLQLLVALKEGGSSRAAAGVLNFTQPALSKALGGRVRSVLRCSCAAHAAWCRRCAGTWSRGAALLMAELAHVQAEAASEGGITLLRIGVPFRRAGLCCRGGADPPGAAPARGAHGRTCPDDPARPGRGPGGRADHQLPGRIAGRGRGPVTAASRSCSMRISMSSPAGHPLAKARRVLAAARPGALDHAFAHLHGAANDGGGVPPRGRMPPVPVIESTSPVTNLRRWPRGWARARCRVRRWPRWAWKACACACSRRFQPGPVGSISTRAAGAATRCAAAPGAGPRPGSLNRAAIGPFRLRARRRRVPRCRVIRFAQRVLARAHGRAAVQQRFRIAVGIRRTVHRQ